MSKADNKNRFSPAFRAPVERRHRISLSLVSLLLLLIGVGVFVTTILLKSENSEIDDVLFLIWAAVPVIVCAVFGMIASLTRRRELVSIFLLLSLFTVVLTSFATVNSGLTYWEENWSLIQIKAGDSSCDKAANPCTCVVNIPEPFKLTSCGDLKKVGEMIAAQIAMCALSSVALVIGIFVAMIIICCGPWAYINRRPRHHSNTYASPYE